eukprot:TRINITY_DN29896_c0_g1_i2.p1 TRINITY_DN29896_c0_g1~~TRINITY_DN29896_c0_g1_i2.p1  ORF type:complete len:198 (-),score=30.39 TRINITY_DN29896_c0_g1_i2:152-745(-)
MFYFSQFWNEQRVRAYLGGATAMATKQQQQHQHQYHPILILDLFSEEQVVADKFPDYYGLGPWVWNMLHTFGGVRGLYGDLPLLHSLPSTIAAKQRNGEWKGLVGLGMTPEAIEHNAVVYEQLTDIFYYHSRTGGGTIPTTNLSEWFTDFGVQRYGAADEEDIRLSKAIWERFGRTMYAGGLSHLLRSHIDLSLIHI